MGNFEIVIFIMGILIGLSAIADRIKLPYPILLVGVGLFIGFMPMLPDLALDPEIVFVVFLPPLLYDAASKTSWQDFKAAIKPISALAITLVFFTTTAVAIAAHYFIPGFSWPMAFVLGAIVSPPDAVAATSITQGLGINKKVITILEGESLVNDTSALIAYRYAVAAISSGSFILWKAGLQFLFVAGGGILIGLLLGFILVFVHKKITDNSIVETSLSLLTPFITYLIAEHFHTSGILAVVSAGLYISRHSHEIFPYETRMRNRSVWDTIIFLLNGVVFILIGLQLPFILKGLAQYTVKELIGYGLLISLVTITVRIVWVFAGAYYPETFSRKNKISNQNSKGKDQEIPWKNVLIIAWTGTRGVVSLATAMALPLVLQDGSAFPQRNIILFLAFGVIFVTLIVQGLSLPLLIRLLKASPYNNDNLEGKEMQLQIVNSIIDFIEYDFPLQLEDRLQKQLKNRYEQMAARLTMDLDLEKVDTENEKQFSNTSFDLLLAAQMEISRYQRGLLIKLHKEGKYSDDVIRKIEAEFDIEDMRLNAIVKKSKK